jgi:hypothetical protein
MMTRTSLRITLAYSAQGEKAKCDIVQSANIKKAQLQVVPLKTKKLN